MNKNEAMAKLGEGIDLKFVATLVPPLIYLWAPNSFGEPKHTKVAYQKGLCTENPQVLKKGVRVGRAKVENGNLKLTGGSLNYIKNMPTPEEFETLINGDVQILEK